MVYEFAVMTMYKYFIIMIDDLRTGKRKSCILMVVYNQGSHQERWMWVKNKRRVMSEVDMAMWRGRPLVWNIFISIKQKTRILSITHPYIHVHVSPHSLCFHNLPYLWTLHNLEDAKLFIYLSLIVLHV